MCLSSLVAGCLTFGPEEESWPKPQKPNFTTVQFIPMKDMGIKTNGYYLSEVNASNMIYNIQEMKYYSLKLELLLNNLKSVYNLKWEDYNLKWEDQ